MSGLLDSILGRGAYVVVADFGRQPAIAARVRHLMLEAVAAIAGSAARADLERRGLGRLHEHLPAEHIATVRDAVVPAIRPELFAFAVELGEGLLGLSDEFFVDDYTILRINFPYEVGLRAPETAENPGIGRVDPVTKTLASSTRKRDAVYDPKGYHKHTPPASWAHGPHKDTWTGHSRNGINLWWAMDDVIEENSMILYPGTFETAYEVDPRSLYIRAGHALPKPIKMALHAGEMVVFNPELLHATHLNVTSSTRVALSARINPAQPRFDPGCFYAREFWHSSRDIRAGRIDIVRHFRREEHLEPAPASEGPMAPRRDYHAIPASAGSDGWQGVAVSALEQGADRHLVRTTDGKSVALFRDNGRWIATQATCPHLDLSLLDGACDGQQIFCPGHGVSYDVETGRSRSPLLRLDVFDVVDAGSTIRFKRREA